MSVFKNTADLGTVALAWTVSHNGRAVGVGRAAHPAGNVGRADAVGAAAGGGQRHPGRQPDGVPDFGDLSRAAGDWGRPQPPDRAKGRLWRLAGCRRGMSPERVIGRVNEFVIGRATSSRRTARKAHPQAMETGRRLRRRRCRRPKPCKRTETVAACPRRLGVPEGRAWVGASGGSGWRRRADTPPAQEGMNGAWFTSPGLVSLTERCVPLIRPAKPPKEAAGYGEYVRRRGRTGPQGPLLHGCAPFMFANLDRGYQVSRAACPTSTPPVVSRDA